MYILIDDDISIGYTESESVAKYWVEQNPYWYSYEFYSEPYEESQS